MYKWRPQQPPPVTRSLGRRRLVAASPAGTGSTKVHCPSRELSDPVTVSVIVPTYRRSSMHQRLYDTFAGQLYPQADLWILDDSPGAPSSFFSQVTDARVHYLHEPTKRLSIGAKRNRLAEVSSGAVIAHFDDDDWYHPQYLSRMVERLRSTNSDLVKLAKWHERQARSRQLNEYMSRTHAGLWGYGFTYVYRRFVMTRVSFPEVDRDEDIAFLGGVWRAGLAATLIHDGVDWVEHLLHDSNMSRREP